MTKLKPLFLKKVDSAKQEDHNSDNAAFAKRDNTVSRFQSESQNQNSSLVPGHLAKVTNRRIGSRKSEKFILRCLKELHLINELNPTLMFWL